MAHQDTPVTHDPDCTCPDCTWDREHEHEIMWGLFEARGSTL